MNVGPACGIKRRNRAGNGDQQEHRAVGDEQLLHRRCKRREAEGHRGTASHCELSVLTYRSGTGTTGRLRCPLASTACTAKITLSFDNGSVAWVTLPRACACSQSGAP